MLKVWVLCKVCRSLSGSTTVIISALMSVHITAVSSNAAKCQAAAVLISVLPSCSCCRERGVWLGLSDVISSGKLNLVNGSEAQEGEEGLPPRNAKYTYVCQYRPQGKAPGVHTQTCTHEKQSSSNTYSTSPYLGKWKMKKQNKTMKHLFSTNTVFLHSLRLLVVWDKDLWISVFFTSM